MAFVTGAMPEAFERGERWDPECRSADDYYRKYKGWYAVLHTFDADGNHLQTQARLGGMDSEGYSNACDGADAQLRELLNELRGQSPKVGDIYIRPFDVEVDGVRHALVYETIQPEEGAEVIECVMLWPRDIMFHPPWDSGEYST
jgi:formate hydrogenlyase regulatory protein HycA